MKHLLRFIKRSSPTDDALNHLIDQARRQVVSHGYEHLFTAPDYRHLAMLYQQDIHHQHLDPSTRWLNIIEQYIDAHY